jgi:hypothetical protein
VRIFLLLICFLVSLSSVSARKSRVLNLFNKGITDVSSLSVPGRIRRLELGSNKISSLEDLVLPDKLRSLDLSNNLIFDLSPLKLPNSLRDLFIGSNQVHDFSVLKNHPGITLLSLTDMNLESDFDFDSLPTGITFLSISVNDFTSLDLAKYTNLTDLNLKSNVSLDYSKTFLPSSLKSIAIGNTVAPDDFTGLVLPDGLETLSLFADFLSDEELATLTFPPNLKKIDLSRNLLTTLDDIEFPESLRKLNLKKNRFSKAEKKKILKRFRATKVKVKL